jgi:cysteine desulfuration protein SufE
MNGAELIARLQAVKSPQDRLAQVIQIARAAPGLADEFKTDAYKLEGCLSNLWLVCELRDGRCFFRADSDSAVVKGLAVIVCALHDGLAPAEVEKVNAEALKETGVWQQLTPNRRTGVSKLLEKIHAFARERAK